MLRSRLRTLSRAFLAVWLSLFPVLALANEPKPETLASFHFYRSATESRMDSDRQAGRFLYFERYPDQQRSTIDADLRRGHFYFEQLHTLADGHKISVPGGLIHHWIGIAFLPDATLAQTKSVLEDYEHHKVIYAPDVQQSHLVSQDGDRRVVFLQFYSKTIVTAVFNVNFDSVTTSYSPTQTQVRGCSSRTAEVDDFGKPDEHELKAADAHGYLWELCTWWHIEEKSGGTYIQVEAIELSRTVPFVFAWIVDPIIRNVPKTFLSHLLTATRKAVADKQPGRISSSGLVENLGGMENRGAAAASKLRNGYSQPFSAMNSSIRRASGLPFLEAATSSTRAWSQFFSTPSPRRYKSASVTSAGT